MTTLDLDLRTGLPDALRVLLEEFPRDSWDDHPGIEGLVRFWLDRHMMFRRMTERLTLDAERRKDGLIDRAAYVSGLSRLGSAFVGELHGHHNIEDAHYFPMLATKDPRIAAGFEMLDKDHHALDAHLNAFVERANAVLQAGDTDGSQVGRFAEELERLDKLLDRHLIDEEDLVVPVILKYGAGGLA